MSNLILTTKLKKPRLRRDRVQRPHLVTGLKDALIKKLILVSAPAGYGKTTLVSELLMTCENPAAWVTLDSGDNDPRVFWSYMINALQFALSSIDHSLPESLLQPSLSLTRENLTYLINELDTINHPLLLILDDYHHINIQAVHNGLTFLIDHAPSCFHLIIITRADPPLPLARLRAGSHMAEFRMADLRFSTSEVLDFVQTVMNLSLSESDLSLLDESTEGWIAGLQMAALSLQGKQNPSEFINVFSGEDRYVMDFLFEEVFNQQPGDIQSFLLQTSILERLNASLCNHVTQREDSQVILEYLERNNLFLIPYDEQRKWYRYHFLFRDLLRDRLKQQSADETLKLYQMASAWYEEQGHLGIAISHALAGGDFEHLARLVEKIAPTLDLQNQQKMLTDWLEKIPFETLRLHPWLCVYRAWGSYWQGQRDTIQEDCLRIAEDAANFIEDDFDKQRLCGHIETIRAHMALVTKNVPLALENAKHALDLLPNSDRMRSEAAIALAAAYWASGDVANTKKAFGMARDEAVRIDNRSMAAGVSGYVALQQIKQGLLDDAVTTLQRGLKFAILSDGSEMPMAGFLNIRLGDILREKNKLDDAKEYLARGVSQCERLGQPDILTDATVCYARYLLTLGDLDDAHAFLDKAEHLANQAKVDPWILCWLNDCRIRTWLANGNLEAANLWVENYGLSIEDPLDYQQDLHHQNLARVFVARHVLSHSQDDYQNAERLLNRLRIAAKYAGWVHEEIKMLILSAINNQAGSFSKQALQTLVNAIVLARPGGYMRVFLDEGQQLFDLFNRLKQEIFTKPDEIFTPIHELAEPIPGVTYVDYIEKIIAAFDAAHGDGMLEHSGRKPDQSKFRLLIQTGPGGQPFERLTSRELDVLDLLAQGFPDKKIAEMLFISRGTVHKHLKNIYEKLSVHSRMEAVIRAQELRLF